MKVLKKFEFPTKANAGSRYDWAAIFSGQIVLLEHGEGKDFEGKPENMATAVRTAAAKRGLPVQVTITEQGVVIHADPSKADPEAAEAYKAKVRERNAAYAAPQMRIATSASAVGSALRRSRSRSLNVRLMSSRSPSWVRSCLT